jgi:hypothetical protein
MRRRVLLLLLLTMLAPAVAADAQQRPLFDVDDFVDPRARDGSLFVSRLILGVARGATDDYRPLHQDTAFAELANSVYWSSFQLDYKHAEVRGENDWSHRIARGAPRIIPAPAPVPCDLPISPQPVCHAAIAAVATADPAPLPGPRETVQLAWYHGNGTMLRYRLTWSHQRIEAPLVINLGTNTVTASHAPGREESLGLDLDTHLRVAGRDVFGSLIAAETRRSGTGDDVTRRELVYVSRPPALPAGPALLRATLAVGGVSGAAGGVNVIQPALELLWSPRVSGVNVHLVCRGLALRERSGWTSHTEVALFADRALFVH